MAKQQTSDFEVLGTRCAGTLTLPDGITRPPVVILAHGFCALRSFRLPAFAEAFVELGFATYLFDYRCFGDSDGEPRHWVSPKRHLEDWRAAIAHVRDLQEVDGNRVVLWGSSFSGGHVLALAAETRGLAGVISQVAHVDGLATLKEMPLAKTLRLTVHGLRDQVGSLLGAAPHYIPVVGEPDELAAMNSPGTREGWYAIVPQGSTWENKVCARIMLEIATYSPGQSADRIDVPVLLIAAGRDSVTPSAAIEKTASRIADCEFHVLDCGHFDPYVPPVFAENLALHVDFLRRRVLANPQ